MKQDAQTNQTKPTNKLNETQTNPTNKSTTHKETITAEATNLSAKISSKILISNSNNHVTHHVKSPNL